MSYHLWLRNWWIHCNRINWQWMLRKRKFCGAIHSKRSRQLMWIKFAKNSLRSYEIIISIDILVASLVYICQIETNIEFQIRPRVAWASFCKYKYILLDHNRCLYLRMTYVDVCVGPALLFGIPVLPISRSLLQKLHKL